MAGTVERWNVPVLRGLGSGSEAKPASKAALCLPLAALHRFSKPCTVTVSLPESSVQAWASLPKSTDGLEQSVIRLIIFLLAGSCCNGRGQEGAREIKAHGWLPWQRAPEAMAYLHRIWSVTPYTEVGLYGPSLSKQMRYRSLCAESGPPGFCVPHQCQTQKASRDLQVLSQGHMGKSALSGIPEKFPFVTGSSLYLSLTVLPGSISCSR